MKLLNFYPIYRKLILTEEKYTTLRLGDKSHDFVPGDAIDISVGWDLDSFEVIKKGIINSIIVKKISELSHDDIIGESPDCKSTEAVKYVLGSIYRKLVDDDSVISVIKWRYF